jgi:hypothetical protein
MSGAPWDMEPRITVLARASNNLAVNKLTIVASTQKTDPSPRRKRRKHRISIVGKACLQRRCKATEVFSIVACVFVVAGICLPSRCVTMNVYSDFGIPAFGRHVRI